MSASRNDCKKPGLETPSALFGGIAVFLKEYKKWWLPPILAILSVITLLVLFAGSGASEADDEPPSPVDCLNLPGNARFPPNQ